MDTPTVTTEDLPMKISPIATLHRISSVGTDVRYLVVGLHESIACLWVYLLDDTARLDALDWESVYLWQSEGSKKATLPEGMIFLATVETCGGRPLTISRADVHCDTENPSVVVKTALEFWHSSLLSQTFKQTAIERCATFVANSRAVSAATQEALTQGYDIRAMLFDELMARFLGKLQDLEPSNDHESCLLSVDRWLVIQERTKRWRDWIWQGRSPRHDTLILQNQWDQIVKSAFHSMEWPQGMQLHPVRIVRLCSRESKAKETALITSIGMLGMPSRILFVRIEDEPTVDLHRDDRDDDLLLNADASRTR